MKLTVSLAVRTTTTVSLKCSKANGDGSPWQGMIMDKSKVVFKIFVVFDFIIFAIMAAVVLLMWLALGFNDLGTRLAFCFVISLIITTLVIVVGVGRAFNSQLYKLQCDMVKEFEANGYSDKFFEIADQGVGLCSDKPRDLPFLKTFVYNATECAIFHDDPNLALQYMMHIDRDMVDKKAASFVDDGQSAVTYFGAQMLICVAKGDKARGSNVIEDAKPYFEKYYGKRPIIDLIIDKAYANYYYLIEDDEKTKEYAMKVSGNSVYRAKNMISSEILLAKMERRRGNTERVDALMNVAEWIAKRHPSAISQQCIDRFYQSR